MFKQTNHHIIKQGDEVLLVSGETGEFLTKSLKDVLAESPDYNPMWITISYRHNSTNGMSIEEVDENGVKYTQTYGDIRLA